MKVCNIKHVLIFFLHITQKTYFFRLKHGLKMEVKVNDWMDILCPQITDVRSSSIVRASFYIEVFNVTAQHYKHCAVAGWWKTLTLLTSLFVADAFLYKILQF